MKKKDGSNQFCKDFWKLNVVTRKDVSPIAWIGQTLHALNNTKCFPSLDSAGGDWQLPLAEEDKQLVSANGGLYENRRLSFGLRNAPATFQRLLHNVIYDRL